MSEFAASHLLSQHLVLLLQRLHPPLQLFDLELAARVGVSAARQLALHGTLGGDGFLQRCLEREVGQNRWNHSLTEGYTVGRELALVKLQCNNLSVNI